MKEAKDKRTDKVEDVNKEFKDIQARLEKLENSNKSTTRKDIYRKCIDALADILENGEYAEEQSWVYISKYGNDTYTNNGVKEYIFNDTALILLVKRFIESEKSVNILTLIRNRVNESNIQLVHQVYVELSSKTNIQGNAKAIEQFVGDFDTYYSSLFALSKMIFKFSLCATHFKMVKWINKFKQDKADIDKSTFTPVSNLGFIANSISSSIVALGVTILLAVLFVFPIRYNIDIQSTTQEIDFNTKIDLPELIESADVVFYKSPIIDLHIMPIEYQVDSNLIKVVGFDSNKVENQDVTLKYGFSKGTLKCHVNTLPLDTPVIIKQGNNISWNKIDNATSYSIVVNGEKVGETSQTNYDLTKVVQTNFGVEVVADSTNIGYETSSKSNIIMAVRKSLNNLRLQDDTVVWDSISGIDQYDVNINNKASTTVDTHLKVMWNDGENVVKVSGKAKNAEDVTPSSTLVLEKLAPPTLSIANEKLVVSDPNGEYIYYDDGEVFSGELMYLEVGNHSITAIRKSTTATQIDSNLSQSLKVEKLKKPEISFENGVLISKGEEGNTQLYCDDTLIDVDLVGITAGSHIMYAINTAENANQISNKSDYIHVEKLPTPKLSISNDGSLVTENGLAGCVYDFDSGVTFDSVEDLPSGEYNVSAQNIATSTGQINSDVSAPCRVVIPNMGFSISANYSDQLEIELDADSNEGYTAFVEFIYYGDIVKNVDVRYFDGRTATIALFQGGIEYNEVRVTLKFNLGNISRQSDTQSYYR